MTYPKQGAGVLSRKEADGILRRIRQAKVAAMPGGESPEKVKMLLLGMKVARGTARRIRRETWLATRTTSDGKNWTPTWANFNARQKEVQHG